MAKFKIGDTVQDITNNHILTVGNSSISADNKWAEYYLLTDGPDGGYWVSEEDVREADVTLPLRYLGDILSNTSDSGSAATSKIKSDGGSSDYYKVELRPPVPLYDSDGNLVENITFETQDILYALVGGEWTLSNIVKACRRAWLSLQGGGKEGNDITYEAKKIHWFSGDFLKRFGKI